jgi:hypothetical protein
MAQSAVSLCPPDTVNSSLSRGLTRRSGTAHHRWLPMFDLLCARPPRPHARVCPLHNPHEGPPGRSRSVALSSQKGCTPRTRPQPKLVSGSETSQTAFINQVRISILYWRIAHTLCLLGHFTEFIHLFSAVDCDPKSPKTNLWGSYVKPLSNSSCPC